MKTPRQITWKPYTIFLKNCETIRHFMTFTRLTYGMALQLLYRFNKHKVGEVKHPNPKRRDVAFSMADQIVEMEAGWLTFQEYAEQTKSTPEEVERLALEGKLGNIKRHPSTGKPVVVWPPELQLKGQAATIKPGAYRMRLSIRGARKLEFDIQDPKQFDTVQKSFLRVAHSLGRPQSVIKRAEEIHCRSCFILDWIAFETFLKATVQELIRMHPSKLATGKRASRKLTYEDLVVKSENFSSIKTLLAELIRDEIEGEQAHGESVHGLINYLKEQFHFEQDPYKAWFVFEGKRHRTGYGFLMERKDVRNALVHDGGIVPKTFFAKYAGVPRRRNLIVLDTDYYEKSSLGMQSIAYLISASIEAKLYRPE